MLYFETERLIFRDWQESDLIHFQMMNRDFEVRRYFPDVMSSARSEIAFYLIQREIIQHEIGLFAVSLKSTNEFIGFIGMQYLMPTKHFDLDFMPCYEIGWRLRQPFWNKGYATEGAQAVITYAKSKGIDQIYSYTSIMNHSSRRIMEKIGMEFVEVFNHPLIRENHPLREQVLFYKDLRIEEVQS